MYTTKDREKLINELNMQLETNTFYNVTAMPEETEELTFKSNDYKYVPPTFKGIELFKPLVATETNPLNKPVYNFSNDYAIPVRGIGFAKSNAEELVNPLARPFNIVDNSNRLFENAYENEENKIVIEEPKIKPKDGNVYYMTDIVNQTIDSQIINFKEIPRELALEKSSKWRSILFKQINVFDSFKNIFKKEKIR